MATGSRALEREVKFGTDLAFQLPDLHGVVRKALPTPGQELRTTYYDTSDLRLWRRGLSLRHRRGETPGAGTWTIKVPQAPATDERAAVLDRTELSWPGDGHVLPAGAARALRGLVRRAVLVQVAELLTTRRRFVLHDEDGSSCGELDDDTVTVVGGGRDGLRFRQLEVEFAEGCTDVLDAVGRELRRAGARVDDAPKLAIALGMAAGPAPAAVDGLDRRSRLATVVEAALTDALDQLLDHDVLLRLDPSDPPPASVHQARVATRRLRSNLKTLRPLLDPLWLQPTRSELKWLGSVLGAVRDADVLSGHVDADRDHLPADDVGRQELQRRLDEQRQAALRGLADALDSDRYLNLLDRLHAAAGAAPFATTATGHHRPDARAASAFPVLVRRPWKTLRRRRRRAGEHPSDAALHRIRIGAKELRYASELAAPAMGKKARRTARRAERLQTVLGEHHDAVGAAAWLREQAQHTTVAGAYAAGLLSARQSRRQTRLRRQWTTVGNALDDRALTGWLR